MRLGRIGVRNSLPPEEFLEKLGRISEWMFGASAQLFLLTINGRRLASQPRWRRIPTNGRSATPASARDAWLLQPCTTPHPSHSSRPGHHATPPLSHLRPCDVCSFWSVSVALGTHSRPSVEIEHELIKI